MGAAVEDSAAKAEILLALYGTARARALIRTNASTGEHNFLLRSVRQPKLSKGA
jgi:hypothetical protein